MSDDPSWTERYLTLLGIERVQPSLAALSELTAAHLRRVPFENFTSLLRRLADREGPVRSLDAETILASWEASGGLCFEVTTMVSRLLTSLGYEAHAVLGQITFPGSHQSVVVQLDGRRYLVDVGCGAPIFEPVPLDGVFEVHRAGLSFRFRPHEDGASWVQDRMLDGQWRSFCVYTLDPSTSEERETAMQRHHWPRETWVVGSLTLVRCGEDEVLQLRDRDFTRHTADGKQTQRIATNDDYVRLLSGVFELPELPVLEAIAAYETILGASL